MIRRHRVSTGLSQAKLAQNCQIAGWDIDRVVIQRVENQTRQLLDFELLILMQILQIPPESLKPSMKDLLTYVTGESER